MKNVIDYDKVIKVFFSRVHAFLLYTLGNQNANNKAIEHNISCMCMFECDPAKFTQMDNMIRNDLFITSAGMGDQLFQVVDKMIAVARSYYNASVTEPVAEKQMILKLDKKAKIIMLKHEPVQTIKFMLSKKKIR